MIRGTWRRATHSMLSAVFPARTMRALLVWLATAAAMRFGEGTDPIFV